MGLFAFFKRRKRSDRTTSPPSSGISVKVIQREFSPQELRLQQYDEIAKIRERQNESIPSKNGLRPHEILLLSFAPRLFVGQKDFPQYWYYKYAVDDPAALLKSLERRGFIQEGTATDSLSSLTIPELKSILLESNLKATGKKVDLVSRIANNVAPAVIERKVTHRLYVLTELGKEELAENEYVMYLHSHNIGVSVWDINKDMQGYPTKLWRDRIWATLNKNLIDAMPNAERGNYYPLIQTMETQSDFLLEEGKADAALEIIINTFYYEFVFAVPARLKIEAELREHKVKAPPCPSYSELVSENCSYRFSKLKKILESFWPDEQLDVLVNSKCQRIDFKDDILQRDEFVAMIVSYLADDDPTFHSICERVQKAIL